jgi:hypothetical protein
MVNLQAELVVTSIVSIRRHSDNQLRGNELTERHGAAIVSPALWAGLHAPALSNPTVSRPKVRLLIANYMGSVGATVVVHAG